MGVMCGRVIQSSAPFNLAIVHGMDVHASRASNYPRRYNAAPSQELSSGAIAIPARYHSTRCAGD